MAIPQQSRYSSQRTFLGHPRAARKARRRRAELANHEQAVALFRWSSAEQLRDLRDAFELCARANPENRRSSRSNECQAPLGRNWRGRERLGDGDAELVRLLLLCATPDDVQVGQHGFPAPQEDDLALLRFEQRHLATRELSRKRDPRSAPAGTDVDDRAFEVRGDTDCTEAVLEQPPACLFRITKRGQARRFENGL